MKTYKQLVIDIESSNNIEEGKIANALSAAAIAMSIYGGVVPDKKQETTSPTPAALVVPARPGRAKSDKPSVKSKSGSIARLLDAIANRRRRKGRKEESDSNPDQGDKTGILSPMEPRNPEDYEIVIPK